MKTEQEKKEIEAIERELHRDGQQVRTANSLSLYF
mgnify:CR=1 FL=1